MTGARKPDPRGEHEGNRKTIAQGMPDRFGGPVVTNSCAFYFAHEAAGEPNARHSLRPLALEDVTKSDHPGAFASRECEALFDRFIGDKRTCSRVPSAMRRKRRFAKPGPMPTGKVGPGSASHHFMMHRVRGIRSSPLPVDGIRAFLERGRKAGEGRIEHRAHQQRQHTALEFVSDEKPDIAGVVALRFKRPAVFKT